MEFAEYSRLMHSRLESGRISRNQYRMAFDDIYDEIPKEQLANLNFRKDCRTLGEFALWIYDTVSREKQLVWEWNLRNSFGLTIEAHGSDDLGVLILDSDALSSKADYVVHPGGYKLEIKYCPTLKKLTYKVKDLSAYLAEEAHVLTFIRDGGRDYWTLMNPETIRRLLATLPVQNRREMGYKPAVQLLSRDFDKYIEIHSW